MPAVVGGQYLNTESGLTGFLDRLTATVDADARNRQELSALARARYAGLQPSDAPPPGILSRVIGGVTGLASGQGLSGFNPTALTSTPTPAPIPDGTLGQAKPAALAYAGDAAPAAPSSNAQQALAYFVDKGLSPVAAAGLVGGFSRESGSSLDPSAVNPKSGNSGIAQWGGDRLRGLMSYAQQSGLDPAHLKTQLDYAWSELSGAEKATLQALQGAKNPLQATVAALGFERPEGWSAQNPMGAKDFSKRLSAAVGLGGAMPADATAYAGQQPGSNVRAVTHPIATGPTGGPMPSATSSTYAPNALPQQPTVDQIRELVKDPSTRALGLQLWQQSLAPKQLQFGKPGEVAFSGNRPIYQVPAAPQVVAAGSSLVDPSHPGTPLYQGAPKLEHGEVGKDASGQTIYGSINPQSGTATPFPNQGQPAGAAPAVDPTLTGEDFLKTLPPALQGAVKAVAEGRIKLPTGMGANSRMAQQLRTAVLQYDPTFDQAETDSRFKTQTSFNAGADAATITAGHTSIQHLGELADAAEAMKNSRYPIINRVGQALGSATGGNVAGTEFNNVLSKYVEEVTKFYRGSGGTEADIARDIGNLSPTMSPDQLHAAIRAQVGLLQGKITALQSKWHQGMGPKAADFPIMDAKSQAVIDRIAAMTGSRDGASPSSASLPTAAPAGAGAQSIPTISSPAEAAALPRGTQFRTPDGKIRTVP